MEAGQYAARNRQGSDWFSHDTGAASAPTAPAAVQPPVSVSSPTVATKQVESPPSPHTADNKSPPVVPGDSNMPARTKPIKPTTDSNQWCVDCYTFLKDVGRTTYEDVLLCFCSVTVYVRHRTSYRLLCRGRGTFAIVLRQ